LALLIAIFLSLKIGPLQTEENSIIVVIVGGPFTILLGGIDGLLLVLALGTHYKGNHRKIFSVLGFTIFLVVGGVFLAILVEVPCLPGYQYCAKSNCRQGPFVEFGVGIPTKF